MRATQRACWCHCQQLACCVCWRKHASQFLSRAQGQLRVISLSGRFCPFFAAPMSASSAASALHACDICAGGDLHHTLVAALSGQHSCDRGCRKTLPQRAQCSAAPGPDCSPPQPRVMIASTVLLSRPCMLGPARLRPFQSAPSAAVLVLSKGFRSCLDTQQKQQQGLRHSCRAAGEALGLLLNMLSEPVAACELVCTAHHPLAAQT